MWYFWGHKLLRKYPNTSVLNLNIFIQRSSSNEGKNSLKMAAIIQLP